MSIKPIDHNVMIPKTQEISSTKHVENFKSRNIVESEFIQQEKKTNNNKNRVRDTEKSSNSRINDNNKSKNQEESKKKKQNNSNHSLKEDAVSSELGKNIDIRI